MEEIALDDLPEDFAIIADGARATVIYDVTPDSLGTWVPALVSDGRLQLFPIRSYRQRDLLKRLGRTVADE